MSPNATGAPARLSRRAFLGAAAAGAGLILQPLGLRAETSAKPAITAHAFDGDALIVAHRDVLRSDDSGATWSSLPVPDSGRILALATHPARPGRIVSGLATGGFAVSQDGGRKWESRSAQLPGGAVPALTVAAAQPDTIYAAVAGDGLWQSDDAGRSWTFVMDRPWIDGAERDVLALASVDLATGMGGIWIYGGTGAGLTRVPDCFCRWQDVQPGDAMEALASGAEPPPVAPLPEGEAISALVSAPSAPATLYAALPSGVWASRDGGVVWSHLIEGPASAVAVHPTHADHVVAALSGALKASRDGGANWSALAAV